jgi:hypothetical protein
MANPEHLAILREGVEVWNHWRRKYPNLTPDLSGAILRELNLFEARLSMVCLRGADLSHADLSSSFLQMANLEGAILAGADLSGAKLRRANLGSADLSLTDLLGADLSQAKLVQANFAQATVGLTSFADVDLSEVKGLDTLKHIRPSTVGIDTIYKSKGKIPHSFLRGAGVPEDFIAYMPSLVGTGIEFFSLFISHSTKDHEFAERLHADLQANGVRCWYAPHDMQSGEKLHEQIEGAIQSHDRLLLLLSPDSMASNWVKTEIRKARKREIAEKRRVLYPICLRPFETVRRWECFFADEGIDLAEEIREYYIPDFSNWRDRDAYKAAFDRLLRDLQGTQVSLSS